jgi:hypothetical protein
VRSRTQRTRSAGSRVSPTSGARERREDERHQPTAAALHHDRRRGDAGALDRVEAGRQPAPAAHELLDGQAFWQRQHADSRLELDPLGPAAEDPLAQARRDAVHLALRAARRGLRDEAVPARAAGPEHVVNDESADATSPP